MLSAELQVASIVFLAVIIVWGAGHVAEAALHGVARIRDLHRQLFPPEPPTLIEPRIASVRSPNFARIYLVELKMNTVERAPHVETKRAVCIVDSQVQKFLNVCGHCHLEKYNLEGRAVCSDRSKPRGKPIISKSKRRQSRKPSAK